MSVKLETLMGDGACFDAEPKTALYRYRLWRDLRQYATAGPDKTVAFVMLNPSTAAHDVDDATIRRCSGFAHSLGASKLEVVNLFAFRATIPAQLEDFLGDVVGPENDSHIVEAAQEAETVICAWGAKLPRAYSRRPGRVLEVLREAGHRNVYCLGKTKAGHPRHPLYLAKTTELQTYA